MSESSRQSNLSKVIGDSFKIEQFFSFEVTPSAADDGDKTNLVAKIDKMETLPLFINISWLRDDNLKFPIAKAPAIELANRLSKYTNVVNSITCYKMTDELLDQILECENVRNLLVLRGGKHVFAY